MAIRDVVTRSTLCAAPPTVLPTGVEVGVLGGACMPALAVRLAHAPSSLVLFAGNWLKVLRVYAELVLAKMVYLESLWNGTHKEFVGVAVSPSRFPVNPNRSVFVAYSSEPDPAIASLVNPVPESPLRVELNAEGVSSPKEPSVVLTTVSLGLMGIVTSVNRALLHSANLIKKAPIRVIVAARLPDEGRLYCATGDHSSAHYYNTGRHSGQGATQ